MSIRAPITRPSNVAGMLLAGRYLYRSTEDDPGQAVSVTYEDGIPLATVFDGEDAGEVLDARDMPGEFCRVRDAARAKPPAIRGDHNPPSIEMAAGST